MLEQMSIVGLSNWKKKPINWKSVWYKDGTKKWKSNEYLKKNSEELSEMSGLRCLLSTVELCINLLPFSGLL